MPGPATKLGSMTGHGGSVVGPGCPTVLINKVPAIRVGTDTHLCPMVTPGAPPVPHVGMPNIGPGVPTVLIGKMPASTVGDNFLCVGPPAPVLTGAFDVLIGTGAGGGGGGGGPGASSTVQGLQSGTLTPIKGTQTFPVSVQAALLECQPHMTPEAMEQQIAAIAEANAASSDQEQEDMLTIADIVEVLENVEREEGYEAARFFASHLDFGTLTDMTRRFVSGEDTNPDNDPNLMPTRFMILYGADDSKLQQIDDHPDCAEGEEHKICVRNLRRGLKSLGYAIGESGPYDDEVYKAHVRYLAGEMKETSFEGLEDSEIKGTLKGYLVFRLSDKQKMPLSKINCTVKGDSGILVQVTSDSAGYCMLLDMPLDRYIAAVNLSSGTVSCEIPWSSTNQNAHSIIIKK